MSLKDQLMDDFKQAMKDRNTIAKNAISMARAAIKQYEVDNREELDDPGIIKILQKQVKMRKDAFADFEKAERTDLVESYKEEIAVLEKYLPTMLSKEEIAKITSEIAEELQIEKAKSSMEKLMSAVMQKLKGQADGNTVREVVTEYLS